MYFYIITVNWFFAIPIWFKLILSHFCLGAPAISFRNFYLWPAGTSCNFKLGRIILLRILRWWGVTWSHFIVLWLWRNQCLRRGRLRLAFHVAFLNDLHLCNVAWPVTSSVKVRLAKCNCIFSRLSDDLDTISLTCFLRCYN